MGEIKITFFMIVTDRDIVIADYAVRSYTQIRDISFRLRVYSNWVSSSLKQRYFPGWRKFNFVEIVENEWQKDDDKPKPSGDGAALEGPYEKCFAIWDRELQKIETPYHATVDADFEILDPKFISPILAQLDANPRLVAMSTDYNPRISEYYDSFSDEVICLNERWATWFCIYKRAALQCTVSHAYYEEIQPGPIRRNAWDEGAYYQKTLKDVYGYELAVLDARYQPCFIHYGGFSKNRHLNEKNIALYRYVQILSKRGLFGTGDRLSRKCARILNQILFSHAQRDRYWFG